MRRAVFLLVVALHFLAGTACEASQAARRAAHGAPRSNRQHISALLCDAFFDAAFEAISPVFDAARLRRLLAKVRNPSARDRFGNTALAYAAVAADLPAVRRFLKGGADPNQRTGDGRTPLLWVRYSTPEAAAIGRELTRYGAKVEVQNEGGATPLLLAADAPNPAAARVLLAHGANPNARDLAGNTPLIVAAGHDEPEVARVLLDAGAQINESARPSDSTQSRLIDALHRLGGSRVRNHHADTPLLHAITTGSTRTFQLLIVRGARIPANESAGDLLLSAVYGGSAPILQTLLDRGLDSNAAAADGVTPLMDAAEKANKELVRLLLERGADPNRESMDGANALRHAKRALLGQDPEVLALLRKAGGKEPKIPLAEAVEAGDAEDVRAALARGEDPNQRHRLDPLDVVDLAIASESSARDPRTGLTDVDIEALRKQVERDGIPLLQFAIMKHSDQLPQIAVALLDHRARLDVTDIFGNTPLHQAAVGSTPEVIDVLISHGAQLEARDRVGNTPLLSAAVSRDAKNIRKLIERGADLKAKNNAGWTPLHLALLPEHNEDWVDAGTVTVLNRERRGPERRWPRGRHPADTGRHAARDRRSRVTGRSAIRLDAAPDRKVSSRSRRRSKRAGEGWSDAAKSSPGGPAESARHALEAARSAVIAGFRAHGLPAASCPMLSLQPKPRTLISRRGLAGRVRACGAGG